MGARKQLFLTALSAMTAFLCHAERWDADLPLEEQFKDTCLLPLTPQRYEKTFRANDRKANFTFFRGVKDVAVKNGQLTFTTTGDKAILGWGNALGKQKPADVVALWPDDNTIEMRLIQSSAKSTWQTRYWVDGHALVHMGKGFSKAEETDVVGTEWQNVVVASKYGKSAPIPDGVEFEITAPEETTFQIEWVKFVQPKVHEGYVRKEFVLPEGKVWKAVLDAPWGDDRFWSSSRIMCTLYINGRRVERRTASTIYATKPVSVESYLKPGRNCLGLYGYRVKHMPYLVLKGTVIMDSGEVVTVNTDPTWKQNPVEQAGWCTTGFDDSNWVLCSDAKPSVYRSFQGTMPGDHSVFKLTNPYKRDLFYGTLRDIVLLARVPPGLAAKQPKVEYLFAQACKDGSSAVMSEGEVSAFAEHEGALEYTLNLGRQKRGVYTIALRLMGSDGTEISKHMREPLVVLENRPMKEIAGTDYREGLDLELEDEIDFTDPNDPHPNFEQNLIDWSQPTQRIDKPRIVKKHGLVYREMTGQTRCCVISYRLNEFQHPGDFYLMELDYPDDADRVIEVSISSKRYPFSETGVGAETGGKFHKTKTMKTLRWLHVADSGVHSIDIVNLMYRGWPAAVSRLRVFHVRGELPSVGAGKGRLYGIYTERDVQTSGISRNFGSDIRFGLKEMELRKELGITPYCLSQMITWLETCDRYAQYLRFSGQNMHHIGCVQYNDVSNTPMVRSNTMYDSPRITHGFRTMMANVLNMRDIAILGGIQLSMSSRPQMVTRANNAQVARGADTVFMIDEKGRQFYRRLTGTTTAANWQHPLFKEAFHLCIADIADTIGHLKNFKGMTTMCSLTALSPYYMPSYGLFNKRDPSSMYGNSMVYSFDDITIGNFERDTGADLGIDPTDPDRFGKRAALLKDPRMQKNFFDWRCEKLKAFFSDATAYLNVKRPGLQLINIIGTEDPRIFQYCFENNESYDSLLKRFAIDLGALGQVDNHWLARWTIAWRTCRRDRPTGSQDPYLWVAKENEMVIEPYNRIPRNAVICRTSWNESVAYKPGVVPRDIGQHGGKVVESDWIVDKTVLRTEPQPGGYNAREALLQGLVTSDSQLMLSGFTDACLNLGHEQVLRELMCTYTHLPQDRFETVLDTGLKTMLAIRKLNRGDASWFYVANPGYWHVSGSVTVNAGGPILDLISGRQSAGQGHSALSIDLAPFGMAAYRVPSGELDILSYETDDISKQELAHMTDIMARVETLMADREIRVVLSAEDRSFMQQVLADARRAMAEKQYALAWSRLKHYRFWSYWKDFLEKAAQVIAMLPESIEKETRPDDPDEIPTLTAHRATKPLSIDGELSEPDWCRQKFSAGFRTAAKKQPALNESAVKVLYDDEALYVGVICAEKHPDQVKAIGKTEMGVFSSGDDAIAIFVQPDESYPLYYQMAFNAIGTRFDQRVKAGEKSYSTFQPDWRAAASIHEDYWTAEAMLPFKAFDLEDRGNTTWRINIGRAMRNNLLPVSSWSLAAQWHDTERFGRLTFQ